jgi:hypothetical protein
MHDRLSDMLRFFLVFILDFLELSTKHKRYGGVRRSRNIPDQTGSDWRNAGSAPWDATARWQRLKLISRARQDLRREARRGHGAATVTVPTVIAQRATPHCVGLTRMLCNSRVGTLFGAGKPSTTLCKEEKPQKRISNLHHRRKEIDNQFHDARICAMLRGFPSNRKTRNTQSTHNLSSVCCWPRRYSSLKSGARTDTNPVEATKT